MGRFNFIKFYRHQFQILDQQHTKSKMWFGKSCCNFHCFLSCKSVSLCWKKNWIFNLAATVLYALKSCNLQQKNLMLGSGYVNLISKHTLYKYSISSFDFLWYSFKHHHQPHKAKQHSLFGCKKWHLDANLTYSIFRGQLACLTEDLRQKQTSVEYDGYLFFIHIIKFVWK